MNRPLLAGVVLAALVLTLVALQATYGTAAEGRGRVVRYTVFITVGKYPEDDPWDSSPHEGIFPYFQSYYSRSIYPTHGSTRSSTITIAIHDSLDILTVTRITSVFSFISDTTVQQQLQDADGWKFFYIPTRLYRAQTLYRWIITIPAYISSNLNLTSFPIPAGENAVTKGLPVTPVCTYLSGGQLVSSSTGLSVSRSVTRINMTHVLLLISISFDTSWIGRLVVSCSLYTTDSNVISNINTLLSKTGQRAITSGRLYIAMIGNLNMAVESGDRIEIWAYYIAPSSV